MTGRPRRNHSPAFKAKVAVIKGEKTLIKLAQDFDVHPRQKILTLALTLSIHRPNLFAQPRDLVDKGDLGR